MTATCVVASSLLGNGLIRLCCGELAVRCRPPQSSMICAAADEPVVSRHLGRHEAIVDFLPGLKTGDSYGAQAQHRAAPESLRWVPAAGGITAPLTSQAIRASPALRMLIAPTTSA